MLVGKPEDVFAKQQFLELDLEGGAGHVYAAPEDFTRGHDFPPWLHVYKLPLVKERRVLTRVYLHIYDLNLASRWALNTWAIGNLGGAFHCGVEIDRFQAELFFTGQAADGSQDPASNATGVRYCKPMGFQKQTYRETVPLGEVHVSIARLGRCMGQLSKAWVARSYHPLRRNCVDFAEEVCKQLSLPKPFPQWVHGIAKSMVLVADFHRCAGFNQDGEEEDDSENGSDEDSASEAAVELQRVLPLPRSGPRPI